MPGARLNKQSLIALTGCTHTPTQKLKHQATGFSKERSRFFALFFGRSDSRIELVCADAGQNLAIPASSEARQDSRFTTHSSTVLSVATEMFSSTYPPSMHDVA